MKMNDRAMTYNFELHDGYSINFDVWQEGDNVDVQFSWCEDDLTYEELGEFANVVAHSAFVLGKEYAKKEQDRKIKEAKDTYLSFQCMLYRCRDAIRNGSINDEVADEIDKVLKAKENE